MTDDSADEVNGQSRTSNDTGVLIAIAVSFATSLSTDRNGIP